MEFVIAMVLFVAMLACWFILPAMPEVAHAAEVEGSVLATARQNV